MKHMPQETPRAILLSTFLVLTLSLCPANAQQKASPTEKPTITDVRIVSLPLPTDDEVTFEVVIEGENLGNATNRPPTVNFDTKDPASPARVVSVVPLNSNEIRVKGTAKVGTEITRVVVVVGAESAEPPQGFTLSIKANPPTGELKQFEIKFEHQKNKEFPNLHSLVVTKEAGPADAGFAANPHWMTVDLMPTGGTDLNIVQSNAQQLDLHFVAAPDYEPKSVVITVYDGSDLDKRQPKYVSIDKKPLTEDADQPKIASTEVVFIDRAQGAGRIRIYGKGFGDGFDPPPYPVDDYLRCVERPYADEESQESQEHKDRKEACARISIQPDETVPDAKRAEAQKKWTDWEQKIRQKVTVAVNSRNPEIHVDKVDILEINDKMIDVYFEFTRYINYAEPFRLADATVTIKKNVQKTTQEIKNDKVTGTVTGAKEQTYSVSYQPGPKRDPNLSYRYIVLDKNSANTLVGRGIAENFFVLQLSVVNNGDKKVAIPLSGIQAEVEWTEFSNKHDKEEFLRGPATLPPVPLAAVSGYFDAYQKVKGIRAQLFNILEAGTMVATGLVPFTGPSFKDAAVFYSGGAVPAARKAWGDLSGQQLQNITGLSWESSETLPAKGGSTEKLIYIPSKSEAVGKVKREPKEGAAPITMTEKRQITNILDVEITGFEVTESEPKQATPPATPSPTATPSAAPAPPAKSTQPGPQANSDKKQRGESP